MESMGNYIARKCKHGMPYDIAPYFRKYPKCRECEKKSTICINFCNMDSFQIHQFNHDYLCEIHGKITMNELESMKNLCILFIENET